MYKRDANLLVHCERCLVWHCLDCAKLAEEVMDFLEGYNSLHWFCNLCNPTMTKTIQACKPSLDTAIETETSSETIHSLMKKTVDSSVNQLNSMMEEVKEQFKQFLKEVSQQSHVTDIPESIPESPQVLNNAQHVVRMVGNYFDRQPRKPSLIVHNLPENFNDEELVKDIIEKEH